MTENEKLVWAATFAASYFHARNGRDAVYHAAEAVQALRFQYANRAELIAGLQRKAVEIMGGPDSGNNPRNKTRR